MPEPAVIRCIARHCVQEKLDRMVDSRHVDKDQGLVKQCPQRCAARWVGNKFVF